MPVCNSCNKHFRISASDPEAEKVCIKDRTDLLHRLEGRACEREKQTKEEMLQGLRGVVKDELKPVREDLDKVKKTVASVEDRVSKVEHESSDE